MYAAIAHVLEYGDLRIVITLSSLSNLRFCRVVDYELSNRRNFYYKILYRCIIASRNSLVMGLPPINPKRPCSQQIVKADLPHLTWIYAPKLFRYRDFPPCTAYVNLSLHIKQHTITLIVQFATKSGLARGRESFLMNWRGQPNYPPDLLRRM